MIEKVNLEKKYTSQKDELREKRKLQEKIENRYFELKGEHDEVKDCYQIDITNLKEENEDLEQQIAINELIIKSYFDEDTIQKIESQLQYTNYYDMYKFNENCDQETKELYDGFVYMKEL